MVVEGMADERKKEKRALIRALMQTEAEINQTDREKEAADKRIKQIKSSRTYQAAGPVKKIRAGKDGGQDITLLQKELDRVKKELEEMKEALHLSKLDSSTMNSVKIR